MPALICGSLAFDTIMVFPDRFRHHILPEKVHILNVSFLVPEMRREFGGCAGNIAYNLKLLGGDPVPMATVGSDFGIYAEWLEQQGIDSRHVRTVDGSFTGQAFITTDQDDNQITAFHPGAMNFSHYNRVEEAASLGVRIGIVAPDGREGMLQHAEQFAQASIPFIFDVGQGLPLFGAEELLQFLEQATYAAFNDYEAQLTAQRTGLTLEQMAERVEALIVTRGGEGSRIYAGRRRIDIPAVSPSAVVDPTGCGDAYRAGLLFGIERGMDWETTGRIASLLGSIKIASPGTQNHRFDAASFAQRFVENFGYRY